MVFSSDLHIYCNYRASSLSPARSLWCSPILSLFLFYVTAHTVSLACSLARSLLCVRVCLSVSLSLYIAPSKSSDDVAWVSCMLYKSFVHF